MLLLAMLYCCTETEGLKAHVQIKKNGGFGNTLLLQDMPLSFPPTANLSCSSLVPTPAKAPVHHNVSGEIIKLDQYLPAPIRYNLQTMYIGSKKNSHLFPQKKRPFFFN